MMSIVTEIRWGDYEDAIPAFVTMLVMPFAWSISKGIGASFVSYVAVKALNGKGREVHGLLYLVAAAFALSFASPVIEKALAR